MHSKGIFESPTSYLKVAFLGTIHHKKKGQRSGGAKFEQATLRHFKLVPNDTRSGHLEMDVALVKLTSGPRFTRKRRVNCLATQGNILGPGSFDRYSRF
jgi:hypothetical protein